MAIGKKAFENGSNALKGEKMRALILILATLFSTSILANSYCESRETSRAIFQCYDAISRSEVERMKGLYEEIRSHPGMTEAAMQQLEFDHQHWAGLLDASCRDARCSYRALENRNNVLDSRLSSLGPSQTNSAASGNCLDAWIGAFRREVSETAPIHSEQLNEWKDWCADGKYP